MLKKIARNITLLFCLAVLWASTSPDVVGRITAYRNVHAWWGTYDWFNGNLCGMSHLDFVKKFRSAEDYSRKRPAYSGPKNTVLLVHGDSYTRHPQLRDTDFAGVSEFHFINEHGKYYYHPDTTKRNILIIEIVEYHVRNYFMDLGILHDICDTNAGKQDVGGIYTPQSPQTKCSSAAMGIDASCIFNKNINQNLQLNLFNYNFLMPVFGYKAALNYYLFRRASGDVVISDDGNFLFYKETAITTGQSSSYSAITADSIALLVDNLNVIYDHYKARGYNEVYLSIIPNAVSMMQPKGYNNLIPLIQNNTRLRMKVIDMYSVYKNSGDVNHLAGDTHWNNNGFNKWLKKVNGELCGK